ncbi:MAG: AEC family transporter [Candidatus Bipolaricaulota bacterium]|nr:MAG: AEC family transporter [Candidatus Bipolaricaulota bacterium]
MILRILEVLFPVALVAGTGFALRRFGFGGRPALQKLAIYVLGPPFIITSLATSEARLADLGRLGAFAAAMYVALALLALAVARGLKFRRDATVASVLALAANNCGNYGLPIVLYGFGAAALPIGVAFVATHITVQVLIGLPIVSTASPKDVRLRARLGPAIPYILAAAIGLLLKGFAVQLPVLIERPLVLVGQAWVPLLLLLLGMELAEIDLRGIVGRAALLALVKLTAPPLLALGLLTAFRFEGTWFWVLLLQASTPTAVNSLLFAREFGVRPDLVAGTLALSTIGSIATVSILLALS